MFLGAFAGAFAGVLVAPVLVPVIEAVARPITTAIIGILGTIICFVQKKSKQHRTPEPQFVDV